MSCPEGGARLFVPGRIEVLGKHTDYAGGRSLLAAVDRGFTVAVEATDHHRIVIRDTGRAETATLAIPRSPAGADAATDPGVPGRDRAEPGWAIYPRTVVRRAARDFPGRLRGCVLELSGTLPSAAGLSTSSALITAVFLALDAVCGFSDTDAYRAAIGGPPLAGAGGVDEPLPPGVRGAREQLAGYLGAVERGSPYPGLDGGGGNPRGGPTGVGTRGGSEDHVALLCGAPGRLVRYAFEPVLREASVPMPSGYAFVVAASGVVAEKKGAARERYNRLSDDAARVAEIWREATGGTEPHLGAILREAGPDRLEAAVAGAADPGELDGLLRRARHFAAESTEFVPGAADALAAGDLARFGRIVDRSQSLAGELLGNQVPETIHLARSARELGAAAASAFGAGFGGSVWALVAGAGAETFAAAWRDRYLAAFPARADAAFFTTPAAPPARILD